MISLRPSKSTRWLGTFLALAFMAGSTWIIRGQSPSAGIKLLARGAGVTMLEGGSGPPDYMPVVTKVAFHVELLDGVVTGGFECLALGPKELRGPASGDFTNNIMYVTGNVASATIEGDTIRLTGISDCTGIGEGLNVPYTAVIRRGGPGATISLRAGTPPQLFREILLDGQFDIMGDK